jgi:antitoxin component of MazEF toxin-antitoxin module
MQTKKYPHKDISILKNNYSRRINIPKQFSNILDLNPGDIIRVELQDNKLVITKKRKRRKNKKIQK